MPAARRGSTDVDDMELRIAAVPAEARDELLTHVLVLLEQFEDNGAYGLDLPGRLELLDDVMTEYVDGLLADATTTAPTH